MIPEAAVEAAAKLDRCELICEFGDYDYSWWEFKAWYDATARIYYWFEDSGCSCSSFMDSVDSVSDLSFGRKEELLSAARESGGSTTDGWTAALEAIRAHDPEATK